MTDYKVTLSAEYKIAADNEEDAIKEALNMIIDELRTKDLTEQTLHEMFNVEIDEE